MRRERGFRPYGASILPSSRQLYPKSLNPGPELLRRLVESLVWKLLNALAAEEEPA